MDGSTVESRLTLLCIVALIATQCVLIFIKTVNWDEFLHYGQVYELKADRLFADLQVLHARILSWIPELGLGNIAQIQVARFFMLGCQFVTLAAIYTIARRFLSRDTALLTVLIYLSSGYVLMHGFSVRADPMATAALMLALALLVTQPLKIVTLLASGALIGLAGMMTTKSILYLPCFAGAAWYRLAADPDHLVKNTIKIAVVPIVAALTFYAIFQWHRSVLPVPPSAAGSITTNYKPFVEAVFASQTKYIAIQAAMAPILTAAILFTPYLWWKRRPAAPELGLMIGLLLPLLSLLFYRNTFPYFFVFLLAPIVIAIGAGLAALSNRYGPKRILLIAMLTPVVVVSIEPKDVLARQKALNDEIHRLFPEPTKYVAYTSSVPDYPRATNHLLSGVGLHGYYTRGNASIAKQIEAGHIGFVLADTPYVEAGLNGKTYPQSLHPADFAALDANFLHYVGPIWIAGHEICPQSERGSVKIVRPGPYTLEGASIELDGNTISQGQTLRLKRGTYSIKPGSEQSCRKLWALPAIPQAKNGLLEGPFMSGF